MNFDNSAELQESMRGTDTKMEFIGFRGTFETLGNDFDVWQNFRNDTVIARLGSVLQSRGIAYDQSFAYFGIYSLQELAVYNSRQRFVTFVEVERNNFTYSYNNRNQQIWGGVAGGFLGGGIPLLILGSAWSGDEYLGDLGDTYRSMGILFSLAGAASLIPALIPAKTTITFHGIYSIYVYDTENKEIIFRDTVSVGPLMERFNGSFEHPETNKNAVWDYYSTLAINQIIGKYDEIYRFLDARF
jgi:hypothetical protein